MSPLRTGASLLSELWIERGTCKEYSEALNFFRGLQYRPSFDLMERLIVTCNLKGIIEIFGYCKGGTS